MPIGLGGAGLDIGLGGGSSGGTSEIDYQERIEQYIGKIAIANPDAASAAADAYKNKDHISGGFWNGFFGKAIKAVTAPIVQPVKMAFEVFERSNALISEPFRDEISAGEKDADPFYTDVKQALTGEVDTTWADNIASYAAKSGSDVSRAEHKERFEEQRGKLWIKGMGFAMDVGLDPLTFISFGGKGAKALAEVTEGAANIARAGGREALEKGGVQVGEQVLRIGDELPAQVAEKAFAGLKTAGWADESATAVVALSERTTAETLFKGVDDIIEQEVEFFGKTAGDAITRLGSIKAMPDNVVSPITGKTYNKKFFEGMFDEARRYRPGKSASDWMKVLGEGDMHISRRAAAAMGGARVQVSAPFIKKWAQRNSHPFLAYRYTFPLWDYPKVLNPRVGNFFRGTTGLKRLQDAIADTNMPVWAEDFEVWALGGLKGRQDEAGRVHKGLKQHMLDTGRTDEYQQLFGNHAISAFMPAAEKAGAFTGALTKGARLWRINGYYGMKQVEKMRTAKQKKNQYKQWFTSQSKDWGEASKQLAADPNKQDILDRSIRWLENPEAEDIAQIPSYLHKTLKGMQQILPEALERARGEGAVVGDYLQTVARRRAQDAYQLGTQKLKALDTQIEELRRVETGTGSLGRRTEGKIEALTKQREALTKEVAEAGKGTQSAYLKKLGDDLTARSDLYEKLYKDLGGKRTADNALPTQYLHHRLTPEARRAILGSPDNAAAYAVRKEELAQKERELVMSLGDADSHIRKNFPEALKSVPKVLEDDIFELMLHYGDDMSEAVYKAQLGQAAQSIISQVGNVDTSIYRRIATPEQEKALKGVDELFDSLGDVLPKTPDALDEVGQRKLQGFVKELNRLEAERLGMRAKPEAALTRFDDVNKNYWSRLDVPGMEGYAMHPYMAAEFHNAMKGMKAPTEMGKLWRQYVNGPWKKWATVYWGGFHVRNNMGAFFNNFLNRGSSVIGDYGESMDALRALYAGKGSKEYDQVWRKNVKIDGEVHKTVTYGELAEMADDMSLLGNNSLALADLYNYLPSKYDPLKAGFDETHKVAHAVGAVRRKRGKEPRKVKVPTANIDMATGKVKAGLSEAEISAAAFMKKWEGLGTSAAIGTENWHRMAGFIGSLEVTAGDTAAARASVMMRQGDYEELTEWEDKLRNVLPFFKWTRTNFPYQLRNLFETPGMAAGVEDFRNALVSKDEKRDLGWMRDKFLIPMPFKNTELGKKEPAWFMVADLPFSDLHAGTNEFFSAFVPQFKPLFENYVLEQSMFTGAPLEGKPEKLGGWAKATKLDTVLVSLGVAEPDAEGNATITDRQINLMNAVPIFSKFRNFLSGDEDRLKARWSAFASMTAGVQVRGVDADQLNDDEARFFYDEILPVYNHLKDLGYEFPTAQDYAASSSLGLQI